MKQLILGGARSGKSRFAQQYALQWQRQQSATQSHAEVIVIATAQDIDGTMAKRIAHHQQQQQRPSDWKLIETAVELPQALIANSNENNLIVVDCLTLWLANVQLNGHDIKQQKQALIDAINQLPGEVIFVSNEVGQGVIPLGKENQEFVDQSGWLHQALAQVVDKVVVTIAGLPLTLKEAQ